MRENLTGTLDDEATSYLDRVAGLAWVFKLKHLLVEPP
jgi:hypothetical protein